MKVAILLTSHQNLEVSTSAGYIIGAIIALFILVYLVYSLLKPEKF